MGNERDDKKFGENPATINLGQQGEPGKKDEQARGQSDTTGPESSGQAQPGSGAGAMTPDRKNEEGSGGSDPTGEGFVGSPGKDSGDYLHEKGKDDSEEPSDTPPLDGQ